MPDEADPPYRIHSVPGGCEVMDEHNRVVLSCGNDAAARNYAALLNEAYYRGYKAAVRQARMNKPTGR